MSVVASGKRFQNFSLLFTTLIIIFSAFAGSSFLNEAEASQDGNLSIIDHSPSMNGYIPAYSPTYFEVTVENNHHTPSSARIINWYVCIGEKVSNSCINTKISDGEFNIGTILPSQNQTFTSTDVFLPGGLNETLTVIFQFSQLDENPTDDIINFNINATLQFTDISLDYDENL